MNKKLVNGSMLLLALLLSTNVLTTEATDKKLDEMPGDSHQSMSANDDALWQELDCEIAAEKEKQSNLLENQTQLAEQYDTEDSEKGSGSYYKAFYFDHTHSPYRPYETNQNKIPEPLKISDLEKQLESVQQPKIRKNTSWDLYEGDGMLY